ncbi:hypothetical protein [Nocardioides sp. SYSU D00038]|uniref:hypothetical protein n=1 Tax=Nocardioides sp. SYSU D00038 TaxID=2812554 RepID=UPI001967CDC7|nr:hypothetical protein [Nocardioides sp. SYSU D00038]
MSDDDLRMALYELQQRVAALEAQVARMPGGEPPMPVPPPTSSALADVLPPPPAHPGMDAETAALVQQGNDIRAIKRWRELTGLGLAEAKAAIDDYKRETGR